MIKALRYFVSLFVLLALPVLVSANDYLSETDQRKAKFNYQMFCQGCHTPDGSGHKSVPTLKGNMSRFMSSQEGREYLVRVPGSANSPLNNNDLTDVLNWMLHTFSADANQQPWQFYKSEEVAEYRKNPLYETIKYRQQLVERLSLN